MDDQDTTKGENRDRKRDAERRRQVVHIAPVYHGERAPKKHKLRDLANLVRKARKKKTTKG